MHVREETTDPNGGGGVAVKEIVEEGAPEVVEPASSITLIATEPESSASADSTADVSSASDRVTRDVKLEPDDSNSNSSSNTSDVSWRLEVESDASMRKRLFTSLSQSFPGSALSRVLHSMDTMPLDSDDEDLASPDKLSSSCFAEIRLDKGEMEDDDLTSLTWLQDSDLLKNINAGEDSDISEEDGQKENEDGRKNGEAGAGGFVPQTHPPHVPYNPLKHINSKPPYSFSCLIFMAIEDSPQKKLPVKDIYNWILTHFPYFQNAPTGWKNSVRHNLSLNKCFKKVEKDKGQSIGKGSLWCIDPDYRPNLLQALRKTPYHPYHQLQMLSTLPQNTHLAHLQALPGGMRPMPLAQRPVPNTVSPHLFPFLSRRLAQTPCVIDSEMQDVANTLVAMKGFSSKNSSGMSSDGSDASGPTSARSMFKRKFGHAHRRHKGPIVCTLNPSEDHTYSATRVLEEDEVSGASSIDNEYDFGSGDEDDDDDISEPSECPSDWDCGSGTDEVDGDAAVVPRKRLRVDLKARKDESSKLDEEEEKKKDEEGAKALLNLAGIRMISSEPETRPSPPKSSPKSSPKSVQKMTSSSKTVTHAPKTKRSSSKQSLSSRALSSSSPGRLLSSSKQTASSATGRSGSSTKLSLSSASLSSSPGRLLSSKSSKQSSSKALSKSGPAPSTPSSVITRPSSLTIMTRRGKAAAEAAALAAAPGVSTRGKKLSFL